MRSGSVCVLVFRVLPGRSVSVRVGGSSRRTKDLLLVSASAVAKGNEAQPLIDKTRVGTRSVHTSKLLSSHPMK